MRYFVNPAAFWVKRPTLPITGLVYMDATMLQSDTSTATNGKKSDHEIEQPSRAERLQKALDEVDRIETALRTADADRQEAEQRYQACLELVEKARATAFELVDTLRTQLQPSGEAEVDSNEPVIVKPRRRAVSPVTGGKTRRDLILLEFVKANFQPLKCGQVATAINAPYNHTYNTFTALQQSAYVDKADKTWVITDRGRVAAKQLTE